MSSPLRLRALSIYRPTTHVYPHTQKRSDGHCKHKVWMQIFDKTNTGAQENQTIWIIHFITDFHPSLWNWEFPYARVIKQSEFN